MFQQQLSNSSATAQQLVTGTNLNKKIPETQKSRYSKQSIAAAKQSILTTREAGGVRRGSDARRPQGQRQGAMVVLDRDKLRQRYYIVDDFVVIF